MIRRNSSDQRLRDLQRRIEGGDVTAVPPLAAHILRSLGEDELLDYGHRLIANAEAKFASANKWWTEQFEAWDKDHPDERVPLEVEDESDRQFDEARRSQEVGYAFWDEVNRLAWNEGLIDPLGLGIRGVAYPRKQDEATLLIRAERDVDAMVAHLCEDELSKLVDRNRVVVSQNVDYHGEAVVALSVFVARPSDFVTRAALGGELLRLDVERSCMPIGWYVYADDGQDTTTLVQGERSRPKVIKAIYDFVKSRLQPRPRPR